LKYQILMVCLGCGIFTLILMAVALAVSVKSPTWGILLFFAFVILAGLIFGIAYFLARLEYDMRYYIVTDRSLRIRKGAWNIIEQTLTFANIQNIKIEQGPIQRVLGFSNLVAETAGGGAVASQQEVAAMRNYHRAVMSGLDNAEEIRNLILGHLKFQSHASGLGDPDESRGTISGTGRNGGFSCEEIEALQEILNELRQIRRDV
jgi:membrane protein YdbS with pleckstrin-like domain